MSRSGSIDRLKSQSVAKPSKRQTPEEEELDRKQAELAELQAVLAQKELDLATLTSELKTFERRYLRTVGIKYAELDDLEARIAEAIAKVRPQDSGAQEKAQKARRQARESANQIKAEIELPQKARFAPSEELKKLYREVAKRIHPDLADGDEERKRRQRLMADANLAFEAGDSQRLDLILREWESSPESVRGEGIAADLIRIIRKISQVRERCRAIDTKISELKKSDLWKLKCKGEEAESAGHDLMTQMAAGLDGRIAAAQIVLEAVLRTTMR